MEPLTFREVAKLINRAGSIRIQESPIRDERGQWVAHDATIQTGSIQIGVTIVYVYADATVEGTRSARSFIKTRNSSNNQVQVVLASSHRKDSSLKSRFEEVTQNCLYLEDFFSSFIRNQLDVYLRKVSALAFKNYVDPQIEVSQTFKIGGGANPVLRFLITPRISSEVFSREIGVLFAEPGQGKTFMTRYLASEISKKQKIPLYVHSEQWSRMQTDEISSLWKTLVHSFKYFESPIGWADGAEEDFVKVALKAGLFVVIFDGFDEYVLSNAGKVDAIETITALQDLTEESGAPILLTTRTSFWDSEIEQNPRKDDISLPVKFEIKPFDENKARAYFNQRLKDLAAQQEALKLFSELKRRTGNNVDFVGRGFFLFLIADLVERGFSLSSLNLANKTTLQWVMEQLCERERTRQKVVMSAQEQITSLREFATCVLEGMPSTTETLRLAIQCCAAISEAELEASLSSTGKLKDHPLIRKVGQESWEFTQDQVRISLLAERFLELCNPQNNNTKQLAKFLTASSFDTNLQTEVAASIVNSLIETMGHSRTKDRLTEVVKMVFAAGESGRAEKIYAFGTTLALIVINKLLPDGSAHIDRTLELISLHPQKTLDNLCFSGTVSRFDFSGVNFSDCRFVNVNWANCTFDQSTTYSHCQFFGGAVSGCKGFGMANWSADCTQDDEARALIDSEKIRAGKRMYSEEDLKLDIQALLRKFVPRESLGTKSIIDKHLMSGQIATSINGGIVADEFKKRIVDIHDISGLESKGLHIKEEAKDAVVHWAANGVFTGLLAELFDRLMERLNIPN
ncbi:NACHT domain-containing protein [Sideroxydans sp.]